MDEKTIPLISEQFFLLKITRNILDHQPSVSNMSGVAIVIPADPELLSTKEAINDIKQAPTNVLLETAAYIVESQIAQTNILNDDVEAKIPRFDVKEISLGRVLGRGGFCVVNEIERIKNIYCTTKVGIAKSKRSFVSRIFRQRSKQNTEESNEDIPIPGEHGSGWKMADSNQSKNIVASQSRKSFKGGRFVLKRVALQWQSSDKITFLKGSVDLAMETKYLAALDHHNIIELVGISAQGPFEEGYFIILEKLAETLTKKITVWMNWSRQCQGITGVFTGSKKKIEALHSDRLEASYDIANAMSYLHQNSIIYRDLVSVPNKAIVGRVFLCELINSSLPTGRNQIILDSTSMESSRFLISALLRN